MKLELHIDGKKKAVMGLDFVYSNIYDQHCLLKNAIQKIKMENRININESDYWQVFIINKSKMK